jgi:hypothetical protein
VAPAAARRAATWPCSNEARGDETSAAGRGVATRCVWLRGVRPCGACDGEGVGKVAVQLRGACGWDGDGDGAHAVGRVWWRGVRLQGARRAGAATLQKQSTAKSVGEGKEITHLKKPKEMAVGCWMRWPQKCSKFNIRSSIFKVQPTDRATVLSQIVVLYLSQFSSFLLSQLWAGSPSCYTAGTVCFLVFSFVFFC